jgi:alkylhydroperoxidase/carboxymuconolactone decarboxylase family protein YurZ
MSDADGALATTSFLDTGLDFSADEFGADEKARLLAWYEEVHNYRDYDLAAFARFMIEHDPGGFKRLKRHIMTLEKEVDGASLPLAAGILMWVYTYTAIANGKGAFYEMIAVRALGASKAEVLETLRLAALLAGPAGMNPLGELATEYLTEWVDEPGTRLKWPSGWKADINAFRSGIDLSSDELTADEVSLLIDWNQRTYGEVPSHVSLLSRLHPSAYKTQRVRFERAYAGVLPAQLVPLLTLHLAVVRMWPGAIRRSVQMAKRLGVRRHQVVTTLFWAAVYGGDLALENASAAAQDLLEDME